MQSDILRAIVRRVPGKKTFGLYRFLPLYFIFGGTLEWFMINWKPNGHNFYTTFKKSQIQEEAINQIYWEDIRGKVLGDLKEKKERFSL